MAGYDIGTVIIADLYAKNMARMDIFKLGDKILALLEAVFGFWNNQISLVFAMLGQSPVSFKG